MSRSRKNVRISRQLALIGSMSLAGMVALALYAFYSLHQTSTKIRSAESRARVNGAIYDGIIQGKDILADVLPPPAYIIESFLVAHQLAGTGTEAELAAFTKKLAVLKKHYEERQAFWSEKLPPGALKQAVTVDAHAPAGRFFKALETRFLPAIAKGEKDRAKEILQNELAPEYAFQRVAIDKVVALAAANTAGKEKELQDVLATSEREVAATMSAARTALAAGLGVVVVLVSLVGWLVSHRITGQIQEIAVRLRDGADHVASSADQIGASSLELAEGASEQAAALEETGSSLEEMAGMTNSNADHAAKADELAKEARHAADLGSSDMEAMGNAMNDIKRSSDDIAHIIKTIDEIAFQTNLLALNAAIEAARAGEAGMGFAVVAEEVRSLAQRSAHAARETTAKIESAIAKAEQGVLINEKVSSNLAVIVAKVRQLHELITSVATASREQSQGVLQINSAVSQMDKVVQGNAAGAEQSASASHELNTQAASLQCVVGELLALLGGETKGGTAAATETPDAHARPGRPVGPAPSRARENDALALQKSR